MSSIYKHTLTHIIASFIAVVNQNKQYEKRYHEICTTFCNQQKTIFLNFLFENIEIIDLPCARLLLVFPSPVKRFMKTL